MTQTSFRAIVLVLCSLQTAILLGAILWWNPADNSCNSRTSESNFVTGNNPQFFDAKLDALRADLVNGVREIVQQELQLALEEQSFAENYSESSRKKSAVKDPVLTAEQQARQENSYIESDALLTQVIANGVLTSDDAHYLENYSRYLSKEDRARLMERFIRSFNNEEFKVEQMPNF